MSDTEETILEEPTTIEEQLNPETSKPSKLNKNGKPRKQMTPEALERLAKAREKANAIRKQNSIKKLEDKVEKLNSETEPILGKKEKPVPEQKPVSAPSVEEGVVGEELPYEKPKPKPKGKKKTKIIVEQSSEDSDEFEPNDNVVFVKRVSRRKPVSTPSVEQKPIEPPPLERQPAMEPSRPVRPELTPQQRLLKSQYEGMFSGSFMNQGNLMRRHY